MAATKKSRGRTSKSSQVGDPKAAYTKPDLRDKLKGKIKAGDQGGRPGQWSARKAQLLASEYKNEGGGYKGGGYKGGGRTEGQKRLQDWTKEKWQTADGKPAVRGKTTARYLPEKAWNKLTPPEKKATDEKKKKGSRAGKQFVPNTESAKKARKSAVKP
jgi:hypothetical protein